MLRKLDNVVAENLKITKWSDEAIDGLGKLLKKSTLNGEDVARRVLSRYGDDIAQKTFRGINKDFVDLSDVDGGKFAVWVKRYTDDGGNLDNLFDDVDNLKNIDGYKGSRTTFGRDLESGSVGNADDIAAEWRTMARGEGHSFDDVDFMATRVDDNGIPLSNQRKTGYAELDGKLSNGDILEVKNSGSANNVKNDYFIDTYSDGTTQYQRQSNLLSQYGGNKVHLHVRNQGIKDDLLTYISEKGYTDIDVYVIPGA